MAYDTLDAYDEGDLDWWKKMPCCNYLQEAMSFSDGHGTRRDKMKQSKRKKNLSPNFLITDFGKC